MASQKIVTDGVDDSVLSIVERDKIAPLVDVAQELPYVPYNVLLYRVNTLADAGYIRLERGRRKIVLYSLDTGENGKGKE